MSFVGVPDYSQIHDAEAIFQVIQRALPTLSKDQLRVIEEALGMIDENSFGLQNFLHGTSQSFPVLAADPSVPNNGDVWINSTTGQAKIRLNGVTRVFQVV